MTFAQFISDHWLAILGVVGYILLTAANQLPEKWVGLYPYLYNVIHSLAASPPAQRFESRYNITAKDGSSVQEIKSVPVTTPPVEPKP